MVKLEPTQYVQNILLRHSNKHVMTYPSLTISTKKTLVQNYQLF